VSTDFVYRRRVQFAETDMAGIVHFSMYFRYMEEAEHALWRSVGLQIAPPDGRVGFPRVAAICDFKAPLHFEDEFEVHVRVEAVGRRSLKYGFTIRRGDDLLATGSMTSVSVERAPDGAVRSVELPPDVVTRLR
jgi:YbgC/YbaW family acyl-CoA thioester hydrolase